MTDTIRRFARRDFLKATMLGAAPMLWTPQLGPSANGAVTVVPKAVLTANDFEYVGLLRAPADVSAFSAGCMTARKDGANIHFLMTGHRYADAVFEFIGLSPAPTLGSARRPSTLVAWGAQVYGNRKTSWQSNGVVRTPSAWWTGDLCWYNGQLYWVYYDVYNVAGFDDFALGMTTLGAQGGSVAYGPWRTQATSHKSCGWIIEIPAAFGDLYCGGARLAVGAGLTSGNASSSWGTDLFALVPPTPATPAGFGSQPRPTTPLVGHSMAHRQERDPGYVFHGAPEIPPSGGIGYWTEADFLTGACWIDLPDKHGLLFAGYLGDGDVWYGVDTLGNGVIDSCGLQITGPHAAGRQPLWWIYDPTNLARVATGSMAQWDVRPSSVVDPRSLSPGLALGCPPAMAGMWFDSLTRLLYVSCPGADPEPYVQTPVIHVWHIK